MVLSPWNGYLCESLPEGDTTAQGVALADITLLNGVRELAVRFVPGSSRTGHAKRVICEWAEAGGYERVFFTDSVAQLEPSCVTARSILGRCPVCAAGHEIESVAFWTLVLRDKLSPVPCLRCGSAFLAQWCRDGRSNSTLGGRR